MNELKELVATSPTLYPAKSFEKLDQDYTYIIIDKSLASDNKKNWDAGSILILKPWCNSPESGKQWICIDMFYPWHKIYHSSDSLVDAILSEKDANSFVQSALQRYHIIEMDFRSADSSHIDMEHQRQRWAIQEVISKIKEIVG